MNIFTAVENCFILHGRVSVMNRHTHVKHRYYTDNCLQLLPKKVLTKFRWRSHRSWHKYKQQEAKKEQPHWNGH